MCRIGFEKTPQHLTSFLRSASIAETCLDLTLGSFKTGSGLKQPKKLPTGKASRSVATQKILFDKSSKLLEFKEEYLLLHCKCNIPIDEDRIISSDTKELPTVP